MRIPKTTKLSRIQLDDVFHIEPDSYSWNLVYEREHPTKINKKTGKPRLQKSISYFATIKDALQYFVDMQLKPSTNLVDMIDRLKAAEKKIEDSLGRINMK